MIMHRLERILGPAEHAPKPGHNLLSLEPLMPRRILGTTDVLDHGEIAQAQNPARTALSVGHGFGLYRSTAEAPSEGRSARSHDAGGGGFSGTISGGFLISGSCSSSRDPSISGASAGRGGRLMIIGSPGGRPGGWGMGSGMASAIVR
jgi:hypothetical protein